jgi:hypothetical protein
MMSGVRERRGSLHGFRPQARLRQRLDRGGEILDLDDDVAEAGAEVH